MLETNGSENERAAARQEGLIDNLIEERLLRPAEVAQILGVSVNAVYLWAKTYRIPSITLGRSVRFRRADIQALISGRQNL